MALGRKLVAQLDVIEDFAVERDPDRAVLIGHRLPAARDVDDAQTGVSERRPRLAVDPIRIGPAMPQYRDHVGHAMRVDFSVCPRNSRNATHVT